MQEQVTENTETQEVTTQTPEEAQGHAKAMSEFQLTAYRQLTKAYLSSFTRVLRASHGVSEKQKIIAEKALLNAVEMALGFGVDGQEVSLPQKGQAFASESANLANAIVKAQDQRMLLVALQYKAEEESQENTEAVNDQVNEVTETPEVVNEV